MKIRCPPKMEFRLRKKKKINIRIYWIIYKNKDILDSVKQTQQETGRCVQLLTSLVTGINPNQQQQKGSESTKYIQNLGQQRRQNRMLEVLERVEQQMQDERAIEELQILKDMLKSNPLLRRVTGGGDNTNRSTNTVKQKSCLNRPAVETTSNLEERASNKRLRDDEYGDYKDDNLAWSESDKEREFELALNKLLSE